MNVAGQRTSRLTSVIASGIAGQNITTMIPMATAIDTADWTPSSRVSAARARSVSSISAATTAPAAAPVARVAPVVEVPLATAARASAAWSAPGRTS